MPANLRLLGSNLARALFNFPTAWYGPIKLPSKSVSDTPNCSRNLIVLGRLIRVKIVRKPVAIVSADSRVVERTAVNKARSSSRLPPAASNAPPARRTATPRSLASTAKLPATALIELS